MDAARWAADASLRRLEAAAAGPRCELLGGWGSFGWWLQGFLGAASFATLIGKRFTDEVRRPWKVWFFDTSKQVLQCAMIHLLNIGLASGFDEWLDTDVDSCSWYWVNLTLDCTVGVLVLFLLLRLLQCVYRSKAVNRPELARSGDYGSSPSWRIFARQLLDWLVIAFVEKVLLAVLTVGFGGSLAHVARALLGWLDAYPRVKLVFVMVASPLALNVFALWTADSFLQADRDEGRRLARGKHEVVGERVAPSVAKLSEDLSDSESSWPLSTYGQWKKQRFEELAALPA